MQGEKYSTNRQLQEKYNATFHLPQRRTNQHRGLDFEVELTAYLSFL